MDGRETWLNMIICGIGSMKIYEAEKQFSLHHVDEGATVDELQEFANRVCKSAWFRRWPEGRGSSIDRRVNPVVQQDRRSGSCIPTRPNVVMRKQFLIDVPLLHPTRLNILHSLTHLLMDDFTRRGAIHEGKFVKTYLDMVDRFYDKAFRREFKQLLLEEGVKTREVSEAQRNAARERWYKRQVTDARKDLLSMLNELEELGGS